MTDLIERAKAALKGGDVFNEWLLFHPIARALIDTAAERDEALNQLDSAHHSVDVLEKRVEALLAERDALRAQLATAREDAVRETASVARQHIYYDSAGTGFQEEAFDNAVLALIDQPTPSAPSPEAVARAALEYAWREAVNVANDIDNDQRHGGAMDVVDALSEMISAPATLAAIIAKAGDGE
jgi:hypothetical protein